MSAVRDYLFAIVATALAVSLISSFPQRKSIRQVVTLCGGLILLICLLRPVIYLKFGDLQDFLSQYEVDESLISQVLEDGQNETARLITAQTEEYILDKAAQLGASVEAEVTLSALSDSYQYPYSVTLRGRWTPAQKENLTQYISQTLGIPEERQIWNNQN